MAGDGFISFISLVGDASEAVVWAMRACHETWRRVRVCQAVRGCVLKGDADAAARGVFDRLFGLVVEGAVPQAATGRSQGGEVGIQEHA